MAVNGHTPIGCDHTQASPKIHAEEFCQFFTDKVANIRAATDGAPAPTFTSVLYELALHFIHSRECPPATSLTPFVSCRRLTEFQRTSSLNGLLILIAPFVSELFNRCLETGRFPADFKGTS